MTKFLALLCVLFTGYVPSAHATKGFIQVSDGQELYVDYERAESGKPTVVLLNGLTYSTEYWDSFVKELQGNGFGILRYDMKGMGKTMLHDRLPVNYSVPHTDQVAELKSLLDTLKIKKVYVLGLSYGGGIAVAFGNSYPKYVAGLILMAPFTEPLKSSDDWIRSQITMTRIAQPWNPSTDDELYDFFLRQFIYTTYPSAEVSVLENPYKLEGVFRLVQGIRKFLAAEHANRLPKNSVHLMIANEDQYIPKQVLKNFWNAIPETARASRIDISLTEHKMPESIPYFSAAWTKEILAGNELLSGGRVFEGSTANNKAVSGSQVIDLSKKGGKQ